MPTSTDETTPEYLTRDMAIQLGQRLSQLRREIAVSANSFKPLDWHLCQIQKMQTILRDTRAELINQRDQLQLNTEGGS